MGRSWLRHALVQALQRVEQALESRGVVAEQRSVLGGDGLGAVRTVVPEQSDQDVILEESPALVPVGDHTVGAPVREHKQRRQHQDEPEEKDDNERGRGGGHWSSLLLRSAKS